MEEQEKLTARERKEGQMSAQDSITINGEEYVKKSTLKSMAADVDGKPYVIVRTYSAGVFAGYVNRREGREIELLEARRLWFWKGAASLSQLALDGVSAPKECKFPGALPSIELLEAIEVIPCSEAAQKSIQGVKEWKA